MELDLRDAIAEGDRVRHARATTYLSRQWYRDKARQKARDAAEAERNDPFIGRRVLSHLSQGIAELKDYEIDWVADTRVTPSGEKVPFKRPTNQKRM